jgi:hypothetical protein
MLIRSGLAAGPSHSFRKRCVFPQPRRILLANRSAFAGWGWCISAAKSCFFLLVKLDEQGTRDIQEVFFQVPMMFWDNFDTNSSIRPNYLRFMFFLGWGDLAMHMSSHDMSQEHLRPTRCNWMWSFMALPCQSASNRGNGPWLCTSSATCVERPSLARTQIPLVIWWTKS